MRRMDRRILLCCMAILCGLGSAVTVGNRMAYAADFTIDGSFIRNAKYSVQQQEPGYVVQDDSAHWISYFLNSYYGMPTEHMRDLEWDGLDINSDHLIFDLLKYGDARVISGDGAFDRGGFVRPAAAGALINGLDRNLIENGGNEEYIIAYHWIGDPWPTTPGGWELAGHVAVYVGNGQVVSHGATSGLNSWSAEGNLKPQPWSWFNDVDSVAIIALTNRQNPPSVTPPARPSATYLGGVDFDKYCQSLGYVGAELDGTTVGSWSCFDDQGFDYVLNPGDACVWQYPRARNVFAFLWDYFNPGGWECYGT